MKTIRRRQRLVVLALLCVPILSGCQWFGGGKAELASSGITRDVAEDYGKEQLDAGRAALTAGRTSEAIDSFMVARLYAEHAAEAHNGLGVAYSQLGRDDLTEKFFRTAIALAPADERFQSNLARFYERNGISRAARLELMGGVAESLPTTTGEQVAHTPSEPRTVPDASAPRTMIANAPGSRLRRVSAQEVVIGGRADNTVAVQLRPHISAQARLSPPHQAYPIRIAFRGPNLATNETAARPTASKARGYPIRITLPEPEKAKIRIEGRRTTKAATQG
jgi:hypothetical protein